MIKGEYRCSPKQSEAPTAVLKGYYTTKTHQSQGLDEDASVACRKQKEQMVCEKGYYCVAGIRRPCPAGRYGQLLGTFGSLLLYHIVHRKYGFKLHYNLPEG